MPARGMLRLGMTVIERVTPLQPPERAVFVTDDDRRARRMRRAAFAAAALACLWLVGLGIGVLGFGDLPGVSLIKRGQHKPQRSEAPQAGQARELAGRDSRLTRSEQVLASQGRSGGAAANAGVSQGPRRSTRSVRPLTRPAAAPAQQPVNPAQRMRGWARKGQPAPPGQVRKTQPPPPPPTSRGQRRGQTTTTTTTTPLPPGQAKKTGLPPSTG